MKPVAHLGVPKPPTPADDSHKAAKQLEAFFLRRLLAEARPQGGGMLDGGFAGDTFKQMLDEAIADKMSDAGGLGLAPMFEGQLAGKGTPPTHDALATQHVLQRPGAPAGVMPHPAIAPIDEVAPPSSGFVLPVNGRQSSAYGPRINPITHEQQLHPGLDLAATTGTPVMAAAAGTVTHAGPAGTYGNLVTIRHANGLETRYAHLSAVTVHEGAHVGPGEQVGNVGSTGLSTGPHLHFEVRRDGKLEDPAPFLPLKTSANRASR